MTIFGRNFPVERLSGAVLEQNGWFCDLLRHWQPAGDTVGKDWHAPEEDPTQLRLAIRDGYLNFYRAGQSVARVGFDGGKKLQAKIHKKYVYGDKCNEQGY